MTNPDLKTIIYLDSLIRRKCTGNPDRLAKRLEKSRSALYEYLSYMREVLMLDIRYSRCDGTYRYVGKDLCALLGDMRCAICKECRDKERRDKECGDIECSSTV